MVRHQPTPSRLVVSLDRSQDRDGVGVGVSVIFSSNFHGSFTVIMTKCHCFSVPERLANLS